MSSIPEKIKRIAEKLGDKELLSAIEESELLGLVSVHGDGDIQITCPEDDDDEVSFGPSSGYRGRIGAVYLTSVTLRILIEGLQALEQSKEAFQAYSKSLAERLIQE